MHVTVWLSITEASHGHGAINVGKMGVHPCSLKAGQLLRSTAGEQSVTGYAVWTQSSAQMRNNDKQHEL